MEKSKRKTAKVYKPQGMQFWGLVVLIFVLGIHFTVTSLVFRNLFWVLNGIILPIYALLFFRFFIEATRTSITIYEDGIEYRYGSLYAFSTWDNIKYINKLGIYFHQPVETVVHGGFFDRLLFRQKALAFIHIADIVHIPTYRDNFQQESVLDLKKFIETEFGSDLMHYAPHLFKAYSDYKPKHQLEDNYDSQEQLEDTDELKEDRESNHG